MPYVTTPSNYEDIKPYIQEYSQEVQKKIIIAPQVVVVDTCSFQFFMRTNRVDFFADWITHNNACVVIFRTILMELSGDRGSLDAQQVSLFEKLHAKGIDTFVLFEEDIKDLLQVYTDNNRINQFLKNAVGCVNGPTSVIRHLLESNPHIAQALFGNTSGSKSDLYSVFWKTLRQQKRHGDSMGEYSCIICIHILANIVDMNKYKYVFLSEDKPAMQVLSKAINNARENNDCDLIGGATSSKVIQEMYAFDIIKTKDEIKAFLEPHHSAIKAWVVDSYALEPVWKTFAIEEFVEYIIQDTGTIIA